MEFKEYMNENIIIDELNQYQKNKINWLESSDYSENSKLNFYKMMNNYVNFIEIEKGKDIYNFDKSEIIDLIKNTPSLKVSTKLTLFSMISRYIDWAVSRGFNYVGNPCDTINIHKILDIDIEATKSQYKSLKDFYSWLNKLENVSPVDKMILVMLRYGVNIKNIGTIKMKDINNQTLTLSCFNNKAHVFLPIDEEFIKMAKESNECLEYDTIKYDCSDYIVKAQTNMNTDVLDKTVIYNRINVIFRHAKQKRLSVSLLNLSRRYDILCNKYLLKNEITINDIKEVMQTFNGDKYSANQILTLKRNFELGTGIKVNTFRKTKNNN